MGKTAVLLKLRRIAWREIRVTGSMNVPLFCGEVLYTHTFKNECEPFYIKSQFPKIINFISDEIENG